MALRGNRRRNISVLKGFFAPIVFFFAFLLLSGSAAFGQIQTRIRMIEASNVGSAVDPALRDVHNQLGSLFNFTSYRLLRDYSLSPSPNRPIEIQIHKAVVLELLLVKQRKKKAEFRVKIKREGTEILDTQVRLSPGRTVLIGGPKHGQGTIILALSGDF